MIFTFDIPNAKLLRISNALPSVGYVFNPSSGLTDVQQRYAFFRTLTIQQWQSLVFNYERSVAIATQGDSAAAQAARFVDLSDITAS
jgi:hypothetical protein